MAKVTTAHVDKSMKTIYKSEWKERHEDPTYRVLAEQEAPQLIVRAEWSGEVLNANKKTRKQWDPFALEVFIKQTHDTDGHALPEMVLKRDVLACQTFTSLEALQKAYNKFIADFCLSPSVVAVTPVTLTMGKDDPVYIPPPAAPMPMSMSDDDDEEDEVEEPAYAAPPPIATDPNADKVNTEGAGDW